MAALTLPEYHVKDLDGHVAEAKIEDLGASFGQLHFTLKINSVSLISLVRVRVTIQFILRHFLGQVSN